MTKRDAPQRNVFLMLCGVLPALLGLAVIIGWHARILTLVQVSPAFVAMRYNTALAIALCGAGLALVALGRRRLGAGAGLLAFALAALQLAEYVFGLDLRVDEWLFRSDLAEAARMAPNAAISLLLVGASLLWMGVEGFGQRSLALGACGSAAAALGLVSVFGYVAGLSTAYGWGHFTPMAVNTAAACLVLGSGVVWFAFWDRLQGEGTPRWAPALAAFAALTITLCLWQAVRADHRMQLAIATAANARHVEAELTAAMNARLSILVRQARRWVRLAEPEQDRQIDAQLARQDFPGWRASAWADPSGRIRWAVPPGTTGLPAGEERGPEPAVRAALELALQRRAPALTRVLELPSGGRGFYATVPVWAGQSLDGFLIAMFEARELLAAVLQPHVASGYSLAVEIGGEPVYRRPEGVEASASAPLERRIAWLGASWTVRAWPLPGIGASEGGLLLAWLVLGSGVVTALLLGLALRLAQTARARSEAAERAERDLRARVAQQRAVSELGQAALAGAGLSELMDQSVTLVRDALAVDYAKVLELTAGGDSLFLRAGVGWRAGLVGSATVSASRESQAGFTLASGGPVVVDDLRAEQRFSGPPLLHEHGVVSGLSVTIPGQERPFGVFGAHTRTHRTFTAEDVHFLQGIANVIATAIERKRATEELDQFFNLSLDLLCIADLDGNFVRLNEAWTRALGYPLAEMVGKPFLSFVHPDDHEATLGEVARQASGASTMSFENRYRARDGSYRRIFWNSTPSRDNRLLYAAARDVTEERRSAEELRRAHDELELRVRERTAELEQANRELQAEVAERRRLETERDRFFRVSRDMLCVTDSAGRFQVVNPAWERTLGYTSGELLGRRVLDFVHPEDRNATAQAQEKVAQGGELPVFQNRLRSKDGCYHWLMWSSSWVSEHGRAYAAARDITALKLAEQALAERELQFRKLFEDSPVGICLTGLDFRFTRANRALCEMLGYSEQELEGMSLHELTHPEDLDRSAEATERLARSEIASYRLEKRCIRKSGEAIWLDVTGTVIRTEDGGTLCYLGMMENITGRRQREEEIRNLNRQLEQRVAELTALNKELEAFTYSISHDLRAPLRHIDGFSKILLEDYSQGLDPAARRYLERVRQGAQQMGRMVDDLLNLARLGRREPAKILTGLGSVVADAVRELANETAGREIEWRIGELPFADCDPDLIRHVFANLLSNAVKFTRPRNPAIIEVGCVEAGGETAVFIRDNGVGFSMKYADKLFGVFQRLHRREDFEGTGVGLATVQRIVHKHGGRIWAEAELDKGATFFVTLEPPPVALAQPDQPLEAIEKE